MSAKNDLPKNLQERIPVNLTAAKRTYKATLLSRWRTEFQNSNRRERLERIDPSFPSMNFFDTARTLPRRAFSTLVQLRLEHFPVADYFHRITKKNKNPEKIVSPTCPNCKERAQTTFHVLMGCKAHAKERAERDRVLGAASRSYVALLTPGPATPHLMTYLEDTGYVRRVRAGRGQATTR